MDKTLSKSQLTQIPIDLSISSPSLNSIPINSCIYIPRGAPFLSHQKSQLHHPLFPQALLHLALSPSHHRIHSPPPSPLLAGTAAAAIDAEPTPSPAVVLFSLCCRSGVSLKAAQHRTAKLSGVLRRRSCPRRRSCSGPARLASARHRTSRGRSRSLPRLEAARSRPRWSIFAPEPPPLVAAPCWCRRSRCRSESFLFIAGHILLLLFLPMTPTIPDVPASSPSVRDQPIGARNPVW